MFKLKTDVSEILYMWCICPCTSSDCFHWTLQRGHASNRHACFNDSDYAMNQEISYIHIVSEGWGLSKKISLYIPMTIIIQFMHALVHQSMEVRQVWLPQIKAPCCMHGWHWDFVSLDWPNPTSEPSQPLGNCGFNPYLTEFREPLVTFLTFGRGIGRCTWHEVPEHGWQEVGYIGWWW